MSISDWGSDVCPSELGELRGDGTSTMTRSNCARSVSKRCVVRVRPARNGLWPGECVRVATKRGELPPGRIASSVGVYSTIHSSQIVIASRRVNLFMYLLLSVFPVPHNNKK